ncbi:adenosylcobinamide-GDP ribazoletransferase [Ramlibacter tataouinensis]|uniref:Adenosylcobinamide-GDP ribazoletransferase n=1 Tax=Ramlibacter tataouinensis (strain ATCC BAA-407 / DSM 14655 / LMG 21543 / TTB310) TaxID=365046 RepID=F5Y653_RAMTT|nr:adenosylcobinamide-GDP ribazoletransferase [Ramlibacter tataouinensis]AEG92739.1 cobalamin synthase-like protein [Ramlibacter tataouinensis TTB310]
MNAVRHYLLALQFFTRVPVTGRLAGWVGYSPALLRASAAHFPGIGLLVGLLAAGVAWVLLAWLPPGPFAPFVAAVFSTIATVLFTGALHEDGLADVADGLGSYADRRRALEIMKDSRIGAFGAMALVLAFSAKLGLLALIASHDAGALAAGLVLAHVLSRAWPLLLIHWLPYVGEADGVKAKPMADAISGSTLAVAATWTLLAAAGVAWLQGVVFLMVPLLLSALALLAMLRLFARRLQGFTGDCLGATQQVCEIGCYLGVALAL